MYVIKVFNRYLTADGTFSERQSEALRVDENLASVPDRTLRLVRLRPRTVVEPEIISNDSPDLS